jgi:hypothetical protein
VTPVAFRVLCYLPFLGVWLYWRGWAHFLRLRALPSAPDANAHDIGDSETAAGTSKGGWFRRRSTSGPNSNSKGRAPAPIPKTQP